jgi:prolyl oligopeptidase
MQHPVCRVQPGARPVVLYVAVASVMAAVVALTANATPPAAPTQPVTEQMHGVAVADPYRNLENLKNPATQGWLKAQGDFAAEQLSRIEGRDAMTKRVAALAQASGDSVRNVKRMPGDRLYYLKRKAGENQFKLVIRLGVNGSERVLVDPEVMTKATGVPHAINFFVPSWDGKTLAYGVSAGGSEDASLMLLDIATGRAIGKPIPRAQTGLVHWTPDSRTLTFNQVRELPSGTPSSETFLDSTVFVFNPREPQSKPRALFGPLVNKDLKLDRLDVAEVMFASDSRYMVARTTDTTLPEGRLYVAPLSDLQQKTVRWQPIAVAADKVTSVQLRGDTLYLRTYAGAPRGQVMALSLAQKSPRIADAIPVVFEPKVGVLQSFAMGKDAIYTQERQGFNTRVIRNAISRTAQAAQSPASDIAPNLPGSTFIVSDPASTYADAWITTSTWTEPPRLLVTTKDGKTQDTGLLTNVRPAGSPEIDVTEAFASSHDGVKIPLAILHRKGLALDGSNPTLLIGYGAYGISMEARFDPRSLAWLERGGVLAYANVRGSGAYGDAWYKAGFKATKANTWKDGIAAAQYLIDQRYTSPKTLGIWGTSAGGIFVGRAVTSAPQLFAAAIMDVGVMDAVRAEESANGITNISEFGSYKNAAEFPALLDMSTYHQTKDNMAYPAILFIHGLNDPRVDVWHSAKAAARFQAASNSGKPVLMRIDGQAGHGIGSTAQQGYSKQADAYSFLLWQFGRASLKAD